MSVSVGEPFKSIDEEIAYLKMLIQQDEMNIKSMKRRIQELDEERTK